MDSIATTYDTGSDGTYRYFYAVDDLIVRSNAMRHACARIPFHAWKVHSNFDGWKCRCKVECGNKTKFGLYNIHTEWFERNATHPDKVSLARWYTYRPDGNFWDVHRICKSNVVPDSHEAWLCMCGDTGKVWISSWNVDAYKRP